MQKSDERLDGAQVLGEGFGGDGGGGLVGWFFFLDFSSMGLGRL